MALFYYDAGVSQHLYLFQTAAAHDVVTSRQEGRDRAGDEEQLAHAAALGRILVTYNSKDFLLLQRAWRYWADIWSVQPRPLHAGILAIPQPPRVPSEHIAREIDTFVRSSHPLENRFYEWEAGRGWIAKG